MLVPRAHAVRSTLCLGFAIAALVLPPGASAAPGGDATVEITEFSLVVSGKDATGSATVMCPPGQRATGGGVTPVSPVTSDSYRVQLSGPVDETGIVANTESGDIPRGWAVSVTYFVDSTGPFRAFAICSADSDAQLLMEQTGTGPNFASTLACTPGSRAIGGGFGAFTPAPPDQQQFFTYLSGPVDSGGAFDGTESGDVPAGWRTTVLRQSGAGILRFYAICSAASDALVESQSFSLPSGSSTAIEAGSANCPPGRRALSGGLGSSSHVGTDRLQYSGPLSGGMFASADGAVADGWRAAARGSGSESRSFQALAVCATSNPPSEPPPPAGPVIAGPGTAPDTDPPQTKRVKGPRAKLRAPRATFAFKSEPGTRFVCRLDRKAARPCKSPVVLKNLKPGSHKFSVAAVDAAGNRDPSPLVYRFKYEPTSKG